LLPRGHDVVAYVAILWESNFTGVRDRSIPLVHQVAVAGPFRRQRVATLLMEATGQLAREWGVATLGITVGLSGEHDRLSGYTGSAKTAYGR
jgi:GNAT superfamily N-acetyltransferase